MTRLNPDDTLADFAELRGILQDYFAGLSPEDWHLRTGDRDKDWTVRQTLAHLVAIAELLNRAVEAALQDKDLAIEGVHKRQDLRAWNEQQIAMRSDMTPAHLAEQLFAEFDTAAHYIKTLASEDFHKKTYARVYNRPAPVMDIVDWQLSHVGAVHAAQITRPTTGQPLWEYYSVGMTHRTLDRYVRHFSIAYWNTVGGDRHETINFTIDGEGGGAWHLVAAPDGGTSGRNLVDGAEHHLRFANPAIFYGLFGLHLPFIGTIRAGHLQTDGDFRQTFELIRLFSASPPKS
jgi:hypothetical protein